MGQSHTFFYSFSSFSPFHSEDGQKNFKEWDVEHNLTSPYSPRANGQAERAVQTIKKSLIKALQDGKDLYMVLLDYRIQPSQDLPSPAELLMGRRLRSLLPCHPEKLRPNFPLAEAKESLEKRQMIQKRYANKHSTRLSNLQDKARVWFRQNINEPWKQGTVMQIGPQPRSYIIKGIDGNVYRRNRFYIRPDKTELNQAAKPVRSVEDFYPVITDPVSDPVQISDSTSKSQKVLPQGTVRKSSRTIVKPERYRDT